jgi:hypothetical protein
MPADPTEPSTSSEPDADHEIQEPTLWRKNGWTARVIKNEDDDGWAVEIKKHGLPDPVLISPWVMGRDKKNPKPFDQPSFTTFVKTATEVLARSTRQREAALKKRIDLAWDGRWYNVSLEQIPDEYEPRAILSAIDDAGATVAKFEVAPDYKLSRDGADKWVRAGFPKP